ncbi:DUF1737 domain-containing protein [Mangrovibacter plantisponsor]|uniref:DUF1737 domain-containing protein n=1 Tax=Mangrovibacter plantisponsor TaxID=451513 RepID=A0A317Q2A1_9ENTR|nr:DUF1737 domain-containing protein [Mangrovibacter plantisponsor]PWW10112.1 hypothetical protein DES37_104213 [Mangrovibacter plantisponsor]
MSEKSSTEMPRYRLLTGPDDAAFCKRVSAMLDCGYELYGSPSLAYDSDKKCVIAAQAVILKKDASRGDGMCE